jgi:hypothetical protein
MKRNLLTLMLALLDFQFSHSQQELLKMVIGATLPFGIEVYLQVLPMQE